VRHDNGLITTATIYPNCLKERCHFDKVSDWSINLSDAYLVS